MRKEQMAKDAISELKEAKKNGDIEGAHCDADDILCKLIIALGYEDVVDAYHMVPKWYA